MATLDPKRPNDRERLRRLFRVKKIEGEMMRDRGYRLDRVHMYASNKTWSALDLSFLQDPAIQANLDSLLLYQQYGIFVNRTSFSSVYESSTPGQNPILVLYLENEPGKTVDGEGIKILQGFVQTQQFRHIILITETGLNSGSNSYVQNQVANYRIEVFTDIELAINPTKHAYTPISIKHIPAAQVQKWAISEGLQPEKLPLILNTDAIAKWYGARPLDAFQFEIMGTTTDTSIFYRYVRQAPSIKK